MKEVVLLLDFPIMQECCMDATCAGQVHSRHACEAPHRVPGAAVVAMAAAVPHWLGTCLWPQLIYSAERKFFQHLGSDAALDLMCRDHLWMLPSL